MLSKNIRFNSLRTITLSITYQSQANYKLRWPLKLKEMLFLILYIDQKVKTLIKCQIKGAILGVNSKLSWQQDSQIKLLKVLQAYNKKA